MAVGTYLLARAVERPLSALIRRTRLVGAGQLDDLPEHPSRGSSEIAAAAAAFDDVVGNLRLLEGKVRALASCAFDDPVLDQQLPGPLGEELARSVRVLSGSIHDRSELQDRLAHQATHDGLTGLPNRVAAIESLANRIARGRRRGHLVAVAFIDLDGFTRINDTYGHDAGDAVLRCVADRLGEASRDVDVVARLGGDEYLVVFEEVSDVHAALTAARRIAERVAEPIRHGGRTLRVGASIGLAFAQDGADEPLELLAKAEIAVHRARLADEPVALFDEAQQEALRRRTAIEAALRDELAAGGPNLELHYQPIIRAADQSLRGFEALIRWSGPDGALIPPAEFIGVAEASPLVVQLDRWVLTTALAQLAAWHRHPALAHVDLSVNVSGRHVLSRDFAPHVRDALASVDVSPERLIIEVTETVLLDDLIVAVENLEEVRAMGIRVAVDDFGTGYTSLAHLRRLPMDELKIDRSFLSDLGQPQNRDLVRTVNELARHVGVPTVAEGIETAEQYAILREIGCDDVQGYLFGRPMPAADTAGWWTRHQAAVRDDDGVPAPTASR
ncbi:putative bifunctional diguanylate cyclase/phosphodiesterase [Euzebya sp.]|uniref:putative bifunctional diguanylate cyclase/phosphodiesterase n=1 Tax=Euzebya sp. TaxID=1971409 RepID=UPI00351996BA